MMDLITGTLVDLRRAVPGDTAEITEAICESTRELIPWFHWCVPDYDQSLAREFLELCDKNWHAKSEFVFTVRDKSARVLGTCGLNEVNFRRRACNLGYWIRTSETGKGYATEAAGLMAFFAMAEVGMERVEIVVDPKNEASQRVAEKLGANREGVLAKRILGGKGLTDGVMFSLIKS